MKLLAEISEGILGLSDEFELLGSEYQLRKSARVILLNHDGLMATQYLKTYTYHKLPGGGDSRSTFLNEGREPGLHPQRLGHRQHDSIS